jgi:N-formylglutamate amidohydrolase
LALIIDCHSFANIPFNRNIDKKSIRPDINIGTDNYHTPKSLIDFTKYFFEVNGYKVGVDYPYSGSIVPMNFYKKDSRVQSIMVEINRKLYLEGSTYEKSKNYAVIKKVIGDFIQAVKDFK